MTQVIAFTAVDIFSKEADVLLSPALTASEGYRFLRQCMTRRFDGFVGLIQTDGGSEFKEDFKAHVGDYCERHRLARPYKKNEQSYIESFNRIPKDRAERTFMKECLGWGKYSREEIGELSEAVADFLDCYHYHRPHLGFEPMRPPLERPKSEIEPTIRLLRSA